MTTATNVKPNPLASILVYGCPTDPELTQASWFRAEDREAAKAAADVLKFAVIELKTEDEKALTLGVHEGVFKGSGRMIVGSVSSEVFRRIENYARKGSAANDPARLESVAPSGAKASSEQTINTGSTGAIVGAARKSDTLASTPTPWKALKVGARVLAAYWNEEKEFEGFWLATVKRIDAGEFTLEWFEAPEYPAFKMPSKNVALVHPEFRPTGK